MSDYSSSSGGGGGGKSTGMGDNINISSSSGGGGGGLYGLNSSPSLAENDNAVLAHSAHTGSSIRLTAKPHAFAGAVLSPKHARELTPTLCMQIASALADQNNHITGTVGGGTSHSAAGSAGGGASSSSAAAAATKHNNAINRAVVPYTLWITEAWRVLGWAEPSAALFWELATMYHTLVAAGRLIQDSALIPPILSCGSTSSLGSGATSSLNNNNSASNDNASASVRLLDKKKYSSVASAKELPVWLVGTFLLLHCEEFAYQRNLSGLDERRFSAVADSNSSTVPAKNAVTTTTATTPGNLDFTTLLKHQSLSARTRLHAGWNNDNTHCTAYLLRHLRKILLLSAVSNNHEATVACMHLAAMPAPAADRSISSSTSSGSSTTLAANLVGGGTTNSSSSSSGLPHRRQQLLRVPHATNKKYDAADLRRQHDDEHGNVGLTVRLSIEDLERLDLTFQPPQGGGIDDSPVRMGEFLWKCLYNDDPPPPTASIPLGDVERELRQHLELELAMTDFDQDDKDEIVPTAPVAPTVTTKDKGGGSAEEAAKALARMSLADKKSSDVDKGVEIAQQPSNYYQKELSYTRLRGTTILLKPNPPEASSGASVASGEAPNFMNNVTSGRLHDLVISDCSDAHFYLLQPFEQATIAACTNCTIVVGAVAGLLHIVDCEKTVISSASRRILVSNSCDVQLCVFTPSPPLLVGDNRTCQFAPYNTYYDGLREDLLACGLAAAVVSETHARGENDVAWPPLQCASNKWKQPVDVSKLEVPQVPGSAPLTAPGSPGGHGSINAPMSPGADDKAMGSTGNGDTALQAPVTVPPSEFSILFVPLESESSRQRRMEAEEGESAASGDGSSGPVESQYCRLLAEVLQLSPFRLPFEYERSALMKAERMKNIQQAVQKNLTPEQQHRFEEELNRGFRDWLVTSGNLRQVLDLVHLEIKGGV